jgi:xanthine dehydrogenase accessory factor
MITMFTTGTGHWLHATLAHRVPEAPMVLVTVAMVDGSGPRETGAKMLVGADAHYDTIGGGHLELRAIALARDMLAATNPPLNRLERFALGPALGQCCGGVVHLAFELVDGRAQHALDCLSLRLQQRADTWRLLPLYADSPALLFDRNGNLPPAARPRRAALAS